MAGIEAMARRAVRFAPFCGPSPKSNRWGDIGLTKASGEPLNVDGEAIQMAIERGWLRAEKLERPGFVIKEADGPWEMMWRYRAVAAEDLMNLVKCDILGNGPGPSEKVVEIATTEGTEEVVLHSSSLDNEGRIEVGVFEYQKDRALIELPRESTSGRWRVWVPLAAIVRVQGRKA